MTDSSGPQIVRTYRAYGRCPELGIAAINGGYIEVDELDDGSFRMHSDEPEAAADGSGADGSGADAGLGDAAALAAARIAAAKLQAQAAAEPEPAAEDEAEAAAEPAAE